MVLLALIMLLIAAPADAKPCFGASAMAERGCAVHLKTISPYPSESLDAQWGVGVNRNQRFCRGGVQQLEGLEACFLGSDKPKRVVALVGDSHSAHWRPAMDRAARNLGWEIISLVGSGCDFSVLGRAPVPDFKTAECDSFRAAIPGFLASRPSIKMVILAQASYQWPGEKQAYLEAWRALPASVTDLVSIVDNPRGYPGLYSCLRQAVSDRVKPGLACAKSRQEVLKIDYAAQAAKEIQGRRGHVLDFTDYFCGRSKCFPVVGGSLVYAQGSHQAPGFNRSLAPYLQRRLSVLP